MKAISRFVLTLSVCFSVVCTLLCTNAFAGAPYVYDQAIVESAMSKIKNHFVAEPDAADTLEDIHNNWVADVNQPLVATEQALEQLERDGVVELVVLGNKSLWRIKKN